MPSRNSQETMTANQMMKGPHRGRLKASEKQLENFRRRHDAQVAWVLDRIPRHSAAVAAVIVKCLIRYGQERVEQFCQALNGKFDGADDPAHVLWRWLGKPMSGRETVDVYRMTVCAAKAYMEGRRLTSLRPVMDDIFDWDDDYTVPDEFIVNHASWVSPKTKALA